MQTRLAEARADGENRLSSAQRELSEQVQRAEGSLAEAHCEVDALRARVRQMSDSATDLSAQVRAPHTRQRQSTRSDEDAPLHASQAEVDAEEASVLRAENAGLTERVRTLEAEIVSRDADNRRRRGHSDGRGASSRAADAAVALADKREKLDNLARELTEARRDREKREGGGLLGSCLAPRARPLRSRNERDDDARRRAERAERAEHRERSRSATRHSSSHRHRPERSASAHRSGRPRTIETPPTAYADALAPVFPEPPSAYPLGLGRRHS